MNVADYANSDELFEAAGLKSPDCVLLDFQIPGMNGLSILKYLSQRGLRIPTIIITAHNDPNLRSVCFDAGAFAYLNKRLDAGQLIQTIDESFEWSQSDTRSPDHMTLAIAGYLGARVLGFNQWTKVQFKS
jgi:FixJ family two-component response regulator